MTDFQIRLIQENEKPLFIQQIQTAFQQPFEAEFGKSDKMILPVADIEESFANPKSQAYFAEMGSEIVGGRGRGDWFGDECAVWVGIVAADG